FYAVFSSVMLLINTVWLSTQGIFGEKMWAVNANFSGSPDAYWASNVLAWYKDTGTAAITVLQLMTGSLMIYRRRMIWDGYRVTVVPVMPWLGALALGILVPVTSSSLGENFFSGIAAQLGSIAYYTRPLHNLAHAW
ncbi:hypothetical protein EV363DRAFT_1187436, partial [Boletus edulis]